MPSRPQPWSHLLRALAIALFPIFPQGASSADVVIHEIMYQSGTTPEDQGAEYIELHNTGTSSVSLSGWRFVKGVTYEFPSDAEIPPGGFLVVAADPARFQVLHPAIAPVVGGWVGQLSNSGERIELSDGASQVVSSVHYYDEGDWADRVRGPSSSGTSGWIWRNLADGGGRSLELVNPAAFQDTGQNWRASTVAGGTPGAANSTFTPQFAPNIFDVRHSPGWPTAGEPITVHCKVAGATSAGLEVTLHWRVSLTSPAPFQTAGMSADVPGEYSATIPGQANNAVIEFYVAAANDQSSRSWPPPTNEGQNANALFVVGGTGEHASANHYRLVLSVPEATTFAAIHRNSSADMNCTFIVKDLAAPDGYSIHYRSSVRIRGNSSRNYNPPPVRVGLPRDNSWDGIEKLNLNTRFAWVQFLGMRLSAASGLATPDAIPVKVSINGADRSEGNSSMGGLHVHLEPLNGAFIDRRFPHDDGGNLYSKGSTTITGVNRDLVRWGVVNDTTIRYTSANWWNAERWTKETNEPAADWSDLTAFAQLMHEAQGTTPYPLAQVEAAINLDQWLRWLAVLTLFNDHETNLSNGIDDDYAMYRGLSDPRFVLLPHDLDTILGQGDNHPPSNGTLFPFITALGSIAGDDRIPQMIPLFQQPSVRQRYFRFLEELIEGPFAKPSFDAFVQNSVGTWVSTATRDAVIAWMDARRAFTLSAINAQLTVSTSLPLQNELRYTTSATTDLTGSINVTRTAEIRINGVNATLNFASATWALNGISLTPGINRVTVQSFDAGGALLEERTIDIWFDDGTVAPLPQEISEDTILTASGGPYLVGGDLRIPAGRTLTLEAGANLWFAKNAQLIVEGTLKTLGTQFARVRLCSDPRLSFEANPLHASLPAGPPKWLGIRFQDSSAQENLLRWTDILSAQDAKASNQGSLGLVNSQLACEHVTFAGTHLRTIRAHSSSLRIEDCTFTDVFATNEAPAALDLNGTSAHIRFEDIPAGGALLIRNNRFGRIRGLNSNLEISNGTRPDPVAQVLENTFTGAEWNAVAITGDALIAGNTFSDVAKDPAVLLPQIASAIDIRSLATPATAHVIRNTFIAVDHAVSSSGSAGVIFENNTVASINLTYPDAQGSLQPGAVFNFHPDAAQTPSGAGVFIADSVFGDVPQLFARADLPPSPAQNLVLSHSLLSSTLAQTPISQTRPISVTTLGAGNVIAAPYFKDPANANYQLLPDSPAKSAGVLQGDMGAKVEDQIQIAGEPSEVTATSTALLRVGGRGMVAFRWRLDGGAWSPDIPISPSRPQGTFDPANPQIRFASLQLNNLGAGHHVVEVVGQDFAGTWQTNPTVSRTWTVNPSYTRVVLNEILADNQSTPVMGETSPDYVELYNPGGFSVDLGGYSLTDEPTQPRKYVFPEDTILSPGEFLVLIADDSSAPGHLPFALSAQGEGVFLYRPPAAGGQILDAVFFGLQAPDLSLGRIGQDLESWALNQPTPGAENRSQPMAQASRLRINEWLAAAEVLFGNDFIELYNPDALPVSIGGLQLSDDPFNEPDKFQIKPLSFIAPGGYAVFTTDDGDATDSTLLNFKLDAKHEWIGLLTAEGAEIDLVVFDSARDDIARGRLPDGDPLYAPLQLPSPGAPNIAAGPEYDRMVALLNSLRVAELMYFPQDHPDLEYIELVNAGPQSLDLTGVRFTQGITFTFPSLMLAPGERVLVVKDPARMIAKYGAMPNITGIYDGRLSDSGESIALTLPVPFEADILRFTYSNSWIPSANGGGFSMEFHNILSRATSWRLAQSWIASHAAGGTPGSVPLPIINSPLAANTIYLDPFTYFITALNSATSFFAENLPAGLAINAETGMISGIPQEYGIFNVTIRASNSAGTDFETLVLTIASSGPFAGYGWDPIASPQQALVPFNATIRAYDAQSRVVTTHSGAFEFDAYISTGASGSAIVFTECGINGPDYWELQNVSSAPIATDGWFVIADNASDSNPNTAHSQPVDLPSTLAAGALLERNDLSADGNYMGFNLTWPSNASGWVMLVDDSGRIRDFVAWGYTEAQIASFAISARGFSLSPSDQGAWIGEGAVTPNTSQTLLRFGSDDHDSESDWARTAASRGTQNPGLVLPFAPAENPHAISSVSAGELQNGIWTGTFALSESGDGVQLRATDGEGRSASSIPITIGPPPPPVFNSPTIANPVVNQAFSFQLTASNSPESFEAEPLPNGLTLDPISGIISGTPINVGNSQVSVTASNAGGSGTAMLTFEILADSDADGLPDHWESQHEFDLEDPADSPRDFDGDGMSNGQEFLAGTDPRDVASRFVVISIQRTDDGVELVWRSVPGRRYRIFTASNPAGPWVNLTPQPQSATTSISTFTHSGAANERTFYRVQATQ